MFRRRRSENSRRRRTPQRLAIFDFLRKPAFQIGILIFALVLIMLLAVLGQNQPASVSPTVTANSTGQPLVSLTNLPDVIQVSSAYELYKTNSAYILDVRERSEWDLKHIPATTLLPLGQVAALASKMPVDKPIIVISDADNRSMQARDIIRQAGFPNVTSMADGIGAWKEQGYPIEP